MTQADESYNFGSNTTQHHNKSTKSKPTAKNVTDRPVSQVSVASAPRDESNKTSEHSDGVTKESVTDNDSAAWSQGQQKLLEVALQQFPKTVADRWTCIAQAVPGKTKVIRAEIASRDWPGSQASPRSNARACAKA